MALIGTFTLDGDSFVGTIETLTCAPAPVSVVPVATKPKPTAPDYRVYRGTSEIGAAWTKRTQDGRRFYVVTLDDPAFSRPIECRLVKDGERHRLIWTR